MIDYIHIFITLITAIIYIIITLVMNKDSTAAGANATLVWLVVIMAVSYVLGLVLRAYLKKNVFLEPNLDLDLSGYVDEEEDSGEELPPEDASDEYEDEF